MRAARVLAVSTSELSPSGVIALEDDADMVHRGGTSTSDDAIAAVEALDKGNAPFWTITAPSGQSAVTFVTFDSPFDSRSCSPAMTVSASAMACSTEERAEMYADTRSGEPGLLTGAMADAAAPD